MRLALTHPYSWPEVRRGAERIVVETARALVGRGHDVTLLTSGSEPGRRRELGVEIVKLRRLSKNPYFHELTFAWRIAPYLLRRRFDAVHSLMPQDALMSARVGRLTGHRSVYEEMGIPWRDWWASIPDGRTRRRLVSTVDVFACMSPFALDALRDEWNRDGVLIPGGVRLSDFVPATSREPIPTILFSAVLDEPRKGLADLLQAVAILGTEEPDLRLWLSGPGDPRPILRSAPERARKHVELLPLGGPHDQGERYAKAWVTALPSVSESFGMVLLESLAAGTPIVVVDDAAPPALVTAATGCVARPRDPESLAEAIRQGLKLAQKDETAGLCRDFAADYDWDSAIAPLLEGIYDSTR